MRKLAYLAEQNTFAGPRMPESLLPEVNWARISQTDILLPENLFSEKPGVRKKRGPRGLARPKYRRGASFQFWRSVPSKIPSRFRPETVFEISAMGGWFNDVSRSGRHTAYPGRYVRQ